MPFLLRPLLLILCATLTSGQVKAVIISGGTGTGNTTGTGAGGGWDYVGGTYPANGILNASGVFLGKYGDDYWVLTANHVGSGGISTYALGGVSYNYVPNSGRQVGTLDLYVFRISLADEDDSFPTLPNLALSQTSPVNGSSVKMIGNGWNRAESSTTWYVDPEDNSWSTTYTAGFETETGYLYAAGRTQRWGNNNISAKQVISGSTYLVTDFDNVTGEAQAAEGDSGGGVFSYNMATSQWELSAIMVAVSNLTGQPGNTAVHGDYTLSLDIATYRNQILAAIPEPGTVALLGLAAVGGLIVRFRRS